MLTRDGPRARDRLAQRRGARRQRTHHGHDLQRRGRHRAPRGRAGDRAPRLPRPPHRAAQPDAARGAPRRSRWPGPRARATASRCCSSTSTTSSSSTTASVTSAGDQVLGEVAGAAASGHARVRPARAPGRRRVPAAADRPGRRPGGRSPVPWPASSTAALERPFTLDGSSFHIGASIGISLFPRDAASADTLMRHADAAMYQRQGRRPGGGSSLYPARRARAADGRRRSSARGAGATAPGDRERRARPPLPAGGPPARRRDRRHRGARALAGPRARA